MTASHSIFFQMPVASPSFAFSSPISAPEHFCPACFCPFSQVLSACTSPKIRLMTSSHLRLLLWAVHYAPISGWLFSFQTGKRQDSLVKTSALICSFRDSCLCIQRVFCRRCHLWPGYRLLSSIWDQRCTIWDNLFLPPHPSTTWGVPAIFCSICKLFLPCLWHTPFVQTFSRLSPVSAHLIHRNPFWANLTPIPDSSTSITRACTFHLGHSFPS